MMVSLTSTILLVVYLFLISISAYMFYIKRKEQEYITLIFFGLIWLFIVGGTFFYFVKTLISSNINKIDILTNESVGNQYF
jgi:hypothetical protein